MLVEIEKVMKTDQYTKTLLTIIAICLVVLTLSQLDIFPRAYADEKVENEVVYGLVPLNADGSITVRINPMDRMDVTIVGIRTSDEMDVNISGIDTSDDLDVNISGIDTSDELDVNLDEVGGSFVSSGGPLKVKLDN
ncbi:MAG: hypothetical protein OEX02_04360 [Cyclobacteriaceae bacterium]|nr:hypothetical protein [Cyclobacteriaceae bacterium]